jgi:hypothetical protein
MAKKVDVLFKAELNKNTEKGGAWLAVYKITKDGEELGSVSKAWSNASAAKRWFKAMVLEHTPRKSIKMLVLKKDLNDKPTSLVGELTYKVEA